MQLIDVAAASAEVGATSRSWLAKIARIADLLRQRRRDEERPEAGRRRGVLAVRELPQRQIGVGWAALRLAAAPGGRRRR